MGLCDRFHKLPSEVLAEDVELLRLLAIEAAAKPDDEPDDEAMTWEEGMGVGE